MLQELSTPSFSHEHEDGQDHIPGKSDEQQNTLEETPKPHHLRWVGEGRLRCWREEGNQVADGRNDCEQAGEQKTISKLIVCSTP